MMMIMTMITITVKSEPMSTVKNPVSLFKKIQEKKKKKMMLVTTSLYDKGNFTQVGLYLSIGN